MAAAIKQLKPDVIVIGVEPAGAAAMKASVDAGHPITLAKTATIADGLMPVRPGDLTFAHVQQFVDRVITVDDADIIEAVLWIFANAKLVAEPSGAATTAAVLSGALDAAVPVTGSIVAIVSGGSFSTEALPFSRLAVRMYPTPSPDVSHGGDQRMQRRRLGGAGT